MRARSGRKRKKGEINGKSANINNTMGLIYPPGVEIPLTEVGVGLACVLRVGSGLVGCSGVRGGGC